MTAKFIKKTPAQIERHRIVRLKRRHTDQEYRERINRQALLRYQKLKLPIILKELRVNGIRVESENFEVVDKKWREFKSEQSKIKRTDRYNRNLIALKERYKTDKDYRERQIKKADKQYNEKREFVSTIVNENERLKRKIKEIQNE